MPGNRLLIALPTGPPGAEDNVHYLADCFFSWPHFRSNELPFTN